MFNRLGGKTTRNAIRESSRARRDAPRRPRCEAVLRRVLDLHQAREPYTRLLFSRRAERQYEYKLSASIAKRIFDDNKALMYPSIEVRGGCNIAMPAAMLAQHFNVIRTELLKIERYLGYGVYEYLIQRASVDFDPDGTIRWETLADFDKKWGHRYGRHWQMSGTP